jgi:hypothetical protein
MVNRRDLLLAGLIGCAALGIGSALWWLGGSSEPRATDLAPPPPAPRATVEPEPKPARVDLAVDDAPAESALATTVAFPLQVELVLVRAAVKVQAPGSPALGSGATASLRGSVVGPTGKPARVEVRFEAGANAGRVLHSDALGRFGAERLNPGLSLVRVSGPGLVGALREVRLRPRNEFQLNLAFARPASLAGEVVDKSGKPLASAEVEVDGQRQETDAEGRFLFPVVAPGDVLVVVRKPGFASLRQQLSVQGATTIGPDKLKFRLDAGATLQVTIVDAINSGQAARLHLLPEFGDTERRFPWHEVSPVEVFPGGTAIVRDLPEGRVSLRLFHAGARAQPARRSLELAPGARESVEFGLEAAPVVTGRVSQDGAPVEGALVRLEAPDRTEAMLSVLGESNYLFLERDVLADLPPAVQDASTNERGEFQLSSYEDVAPERYVTALSRDGRHSAHAVLRPGQVRVDLALEPVTGGAGELAIQTTERWQALPVELVVDGEPRAPFLLPPGQDLRIDGLPEGTWRVRVRWDTERLVDGHELEIQGETRLYVGLPPGAITGQDSDTIRRTGRR